MAPRALMFLTLVLLASCVPPALRVAAPVAQESVTAEALREMPVAQAVTEIDRVTAPGHAAAPFEGQEGGARALDCLTAAVYYEARSESADGQRAVAQVVLNRVRHPAFPRSICGVVFQGRERRTGCQFSFTCDGSMHRQREPGAWERARAVAEAALTGYVYAPVGLSTHFHTTAIHPWWASSMRRAVTVGAHIFYRWPGQWGDPLAFRQPYQGWEGGVPTAPIASADRTGESETVMGVTVHRGTIAAPTVDSASAPSASAPVRVARVEQNGVRVHRGGGSARGVTVRSSVAEGDDAATGTPAAAMPTR